MKTIRGIALLLLVGLMVISCSPAAVPSTGSQPAAPTAVGATAAAPTTAATLPAAMPTTPAANTASPTAAATTAPAAAAANAAAPVKVTSKDLNLYGWSEYIPQALLDGFEKEYGVKVHYDAYSSNEEMVAKLQAGASGYDVIIPSDYMVTILAKQNLIQPIDLAQIPNISNVDPRFRGLSYDPENKYTVPYQWGTVGMAINRDKVKDQITSWGDLWNAQYKNRVVLLDDTREVIGMALRVLGHDLNATDPAQLAQAKEKLIALQPNVKLYDSDNPKAALLSGEVWLGMTWNGEAALAHQQNPNIDYVCPKEGCVVWFDSLAVPTGAPHLDAAQAFLNYVLRPDVSLLITKEFPYSNPNKAALDLLQTQDPAAYKTYMGFAATNPSEEYMKNGKMVVDVGDATTLWDQIYTEIKGNH